MNIYIYSLNFLKECFKLRLLRKGWAKYDLQVLFPLVPNTTTLMSLSHPLVLGSYHHPREFAVLFIHLSALRKPSGYERYSHESCPDS
jgi:hypothetical protein